MKNKIIENIDNHEMLESLYRSDKKAFEKAFIEIYPEIGNNKISAFWKTRLEHEHKKENLVIIRKNDVYLIIIACIITGFLIKIPQIFNINFTDYHFYEKNTGLIVFFGLSLYAFLTKNLIETKQLIISASIFILSVVYVNFLPSKYESNSIILAFIHLPLMIWCLYGLIFIDFDLKNKSKRIDFIKYNGDLAILGGIILIAGGILTAVTVGLFSAIGLAIERFYFDYIVITGLVSAPIVATFVVRNYPFVTNKIAPLIASIFSPIVCATLIIYLITIIVSGKDLYNDRDFLIVFNLMLLGVMGIIVFSISETSINRKQRFNELVLLALTIITLLVDLFALSAIVYRLGEFGFTPNRTAVLGSNILIFGNLLLIMFDLFKVNFKKKELKEVELTISNFLPVYALWSIFVVFVLPFIFGFK